MRGKVLLISALLSGCSALNRSEINLRDNLANRGPVSLSRSNPYIASNILLSKEVESNSTLKGFLKVRGNPDAIEMKKVLLRPYMMYFFYSAAKEVYIVEEANGDWIIRGPQMIPEQVQEVLARIVPKNPEPMGEKSAALELESSPIDVEQPSEIPDEGGEPVKQLAPEPERALPVASEKAEPAEKSEGDILHKVQFRGETLRLIAEWYTGKADAAARLARINGMADANSLNFGQTVRIPRYLVTNAKPLTNERVEKYRESH